MRISSMGRGGAAMVVIATAARAAAAQQMPPAVYISEADIPCPYEIVDTLRGPITASSLHEYVLERDRTVLRVASARGGNSAFIPEDEQEPGRRGVGFPVTFVDGVPQETRREVTATAIRLITKGCPAVDAVSLAGRFEGVITYGGSANGVELPPSTHYIRGTLFRQEMATSGPVEALFVDELDRHGFRFDRDLVTLTPIGLPPVSGAPLVVTQLSETDTIAGAECRMVRLELEETTLTVCAAAGFGVTSGGVTPPRFSVLEIARAFPDGFVPLRVLQETPEGTSEVVATSFEPGPLDEAVFAPIGR